MGLVLQALGLLFLLNIARSAPSPRSTDENAAQSFLDEYETKASQYCTNFNLADWNYQTNITNQTSRQLVQAQLDWAKYDREAWKKATQFEWQQMSDEAIRRQLHLLSVLGLAALDQDALQELTQTIADLQGIYGTTKVCQLGKPENCELRLEPDIAQIMAKSRNAKQLKHIWQEWHEKSGRPMRPLYQKYVELSNKAAQANGLHDRGEMWRSRYEADDFERSLERLWSQIKPLYQQLHAYVRRRLRLWYGSEVVAQSGPIPAHLLGNIWAQDWGNILEMTLPFPEKVAIDVTPEMVKQEYTPLAMFDLSDKFFTSLGLEPLPPSFWNRSMLVRPEGREVVCHASAWDFCDRKDVRIKMCTEVNMNDLVTVHHEMGHIQYFMQYKDQPYKFREGANPGFHEAVGDTLALSVSTPSHLNKIGLLPVVEDNKEGEINYLLGMALDKLAFLPFGYVIDLWRWQVFRGDITESDYNAKWWELRLKYQGIVPPVERSEDDFDPGAKYHVAADVPYIRYFVSFVIQFQFHQSLCLAAGQYIPGDPAHPLHQCDIYYNQEAGALLKSMLSLGISKPWPEAMKVITRGQTDQMDASALVEYFRPLLDFLEKENTKTGEQIGWD